MRCLILSDIHANWHALQAVLEDAAGRFDQIICCGDLVGYGANPNQVVDWVRDNVTTVVRGNHDKACSGLDSLEWFNPIARTSAVWTMETLTPENTAYLRGLPQGPIQLEHFRIFHGSPADEDEYMVSTQDVMCLRFLVEGHVSFFGHTHVQGGFFLTHKAISKIPRPPLESVGQEIELEDNIRYLINPGSVGQPRDGDPRAAYVLYDTDQPRLTYCRVEYDIAAAQAQIRAEGLPDVLANRLAIGA